MMWTEKSLAELTPAQQALCKYHLMPEELVVNSLLNIIRFDSAQLDRIQSYAQKLIQAVLIKPQTSLSLDRFLAEYDLSSEEGVALMCLAEALLRIPDNGTVDALIQDKITRGNWKAHAGKSDSFFVNAATRALMLTSKILETSSQDNVVKKGIAYCGKPIIRNATRQAMRILGKQFVFSQTIEEGLIRAEREHIFHSLCSFDMLGEAALTADDAKMYFDRYAHAIKTLAGHTAKNGLGDLFSNHGVSVKISALSPRYEFTQKGTQQKEWVERVLELAVLAKQANIGLTIDAEEADRLEISLDIIEQVFLSRELAGYEGFGLAVQAYQKRAPAVISWLQELAERGKRRVAVRLVKGAYWDSEIKRAQEFGLSGYPVFTRKCTTDVSYLACAKLLLSAADHFYLQFATHNGFTLAAVRDMAQERKVTAYEFQRLHGMGESLYDVLLKDNPELRCRVYAPVGGYEHLLAYLVRRLLENGANSSFVKQLNQAGSVDGSAKDKSSIEDLLSDPITQISALKEKAHPKIPLPQKIFGPQRDNSRGIILTNEQVLRELKLALEQATAQPWLAAPLVNGEVIKNTTPQEVFDPANLQRKIGQVYWAELTDVQTALNSSVAAQEKWDATSVEERAKCLERAADLFEQHMPELMALAILEAGKTIPNAIGEVREAVDFLRYYANSAREWMAVPRELQGPTGEKNILEMHGRGVFVCISPWNFPLAIFTGQVSAALVSGNAVIAKPAEQTPLMAHKAIMLLHQAGIPREVLHCLPGAGETIGAALVNDERIAGVMFTGSTEVARLINQTLAKRQGAIVPFVAETGGQNVMIVDSSALPEQVVTDVVRSAFDSAGQRCSALRILCVPKEIAGTILPMLEGAMQELVVGDPSLLVTDVGPVIDKAAQEMLLAHCKKMDAEAKLLSRVALPDSLPSGFYVAPTAYQIDKIAQLSREVFGPILHVVLYDAPLLEQLIDEINATGYGLTFGVHSRIQNTIDFIVERVNVGNVYVNRNIIGAVVGVQPFGGRGLSGTGPKAGGPNYLLRLMEEKVVSTNTVAMGGNASLLDLE